MYKLYLAPLEGITGYCYRSCIEKYFGGGIDKYYTPFFAPHTKRTMNTKEMNDVLPEHNKGMYLVPQILTNSSDDFLRFEQDMRNMFGYEETNINIGCPSGTVVSKKRGAGLLADKSLLDEFLYGVFEKKQGKVSLKVRLGIDSPLEFFEIFDVLNKYNAQELIIHPRVRNEFYKGECHFEIFKHAYDNSNCPLCWSGDINTIADFENLIGKFPKLQAVMLGRGMVADPSLIRQLKGGCKMSRDEIKGFHEDLLEGLSQILPGSVPLMHKMKEIWFYMINTFQSECFEKIGCSKERMLKKIQKCKSMSEYRTIADTLLMKYEL